MAEIRSLRAVRFDAQAAGPVGPLLAPPYDAATGPGNLAEFSISRIENADLGAAGDQHALAARRYQDWLARGILVRDEEPALYVHRHRFMADGAPFTRTGLLARVRLADWEARVVLPHEGTTPGPRQERLARLRAVGANLSPHYFLFDDGDGRAGAAIDEALVAGADELRDRTDGEHWLGRISDVASQERISAAFRERSLFVADGHHRYEAALAYRDACRARELGVDGPWNYVLVLLAAVQDPGVIVRPTHRLLRGGTAIRAASVLQTLQRWFALRPVTDPAAVAVEDTLFRLVLPEGLWDIAELPGAPHEALLPRGRSRAWGNLGVAVLQGVLESMVGATRQGNRPAVAPIADACEAKRQVRSGEASAAFLLPQPDLGSLLAVAAEGDILPPKSTWFEPKAPAGLVINDLRRH